MATHVVVIDTSFRRQNVKVNPGTYMTDVLDEACKKLGIQSRNYGLKNNNKAVDLSRTFRQTGLTSGAKLELVVASRSPSVVSIALQLPDILSSTIPGGRLTDKFPSDTTLWLVLRKFESTEGKNFNFTARGTTKIENDNVLEGRVFYEMPSLQIMGRDLSTFGALQKTLAQYGLNSGSGLIKLRFNATGQPLEEALMEIGQYFKEETTAEKNPAETPEAENLATGISKLPFSENAPAGDVNMISDRTLDTSQTTSSESTENPKTSPSVTPSKRPAPVVTAEPPKNQLLGPGQRPISVFSPPSGNTPKAALAPYVDDDFEPTVAHAKLHQARLLDSSHNKRLLSDAEAEKIANQKAAELAVLKDVNIRIRFPDQSSITSPFKATDTGADLYKYAAGVIIAEDAHFKLVNYEKGAQTIPRDENKKLIKDLGFKRGVLVNFVWEDDASADARRPPVLKPEYRNAAVEIPIPEIASQPTGPSEPSPADIVKEQLGNVGKDLKKVPKWLKGFGGKK